MRRLLFALILVFAGLVPALAREEIRSFAADIELRGDGSVMVIETIDVNAEGVDIRRGIYRDIPVIMLDDEGNRLRPVLDVIEVTRDGDEEPFRVERMGDFRRIWIGDADVFLPRGEHRYTIRYTMSRMARSFADYDELYWNVTGNYWIFPIQRAVASIRLPQGAVVQDVQGYTGRTGSTEQAVTVSDANGGRVVVRANRPLGAGEGMTVSVSFAKGVLVAPDTLTQALYWLQDRQDVLVPSAFVLLLLGYFGMAWNAVGRDPPKGTIIPLFHPPEGFSPALTHFVHNWGWKNQWTAFTAAAFNLGVKGLVTIDNTDKQLTLSVTGRQPETPLPPGEAVLFGYLNSRGSVTIGKSEGPALGQKRLEFSSAIERENRDKWFRDHAGYSVLGIVLAAASLGIMVWLGYLEIGFLVLAGVLGIFIGIGFALLRSAWGGNKLQLLFGGVWLSVVLANMVGGFGVLFANSFLSTGLIAAVSIVVICIVFAMLMRAPTVQGRKVMDQIEGFKLYLDTAEKERLNITNEPPMTLERFERILPYAIALGVEAPWTAHFEAELARGGVADVTGSEYRPRWYRGSMSGGSFAPADMARSVSGAAAAMSAAMVAAQPVSSSSSGGGGGGSSGGGGGGGGGGGW